MPWHGYTLPGLGAPGLLEPHIVAQSGEPAPGSSRQAGAQWGETDEKEVLEMWRTGEEERVAREEKREAEDMRRANAQARGASIGAEHHFGEGSWGLPVPVPTGGIQSMVQGRNN